MVKTITYQNFGLGIHVSKYCKGDNLRVGDDKMALGPTCRGGGHTMLFMC